MLPFWFNLLKKPHKNNNVFTLSLLKHHWLFYTIFLPHWIQIFWPVYHTCCKDGTVICFGGVRWNERKKLILFLHLAALAVVQGFCGNWLSPGCHVVRGSILAMNWLISMPTPARRSFDVPVCCLWVVYQDCQDFGCCKEEGVFWNTKLWRHHGSPVQEAHSGIQAKLQPSCSQALILHFTMEIKALYFAKTVLSFFQIMLL